MASEDKTLGSAAGTILVVEDEQAQRETLCAFAVSKSCQFAFSDWPTCAVASSIGLPVAISSRTPSTSACR